MSELDYDIYTLPDFSLQSGTTLPKAQLAYKTYGRLNDDRSNVILYPTSYGAQHTDIDWLIGPDQILDSDRYFIIIPNMFGNGLSSSPSNLPDPAAGEDYPAFTHVDNVTAQQRMLQDVFGIERLAMVYGWSMGGQQALHWGALYPGCVERIAAICTTAKTSPHNIVFLEGLRSALIADPAWDGHRFTANPEAGLRAYGRIYAGWALSQAFYRELMHIQLGYSSLEEFLVKEWEAAFLRRNPDNLLSMLETWIRSDISNNNRYHGDLPQAYAAIQAKTFIMPGSMDLYFTPEDSQADAEKIANAEFRPIPSIWGHRAGNPRNSAEDQQFLKNAIAELLNAE